MIESGQCVTLVTGILSLGYFFTVHLFHVGDWGLLFFPVGWDFYVAKMVWRMFNCRCVRLRFLFTRYCTALRAHFSPVLARFWLGLLCCSSLLLFAWTRTTLLAGESAVVLSGDDRCFRHYW